MKSSIKIIIGIVVILILTIVIDLVCIFTINMPIFVISEDYRIIRISDLDIIL